MNTTVYVSSSQNKACTEFEPMTCDAGAMLYQLS